MRGAPLLRLAAVSGLASAAALLSSLAIENRTSKRAFVALGIASAGATLAQLAIQERRAVEARQQEITQLAGPARRPGRWRSRLVVLGGLTTIFAILAAFVMIELRLATESAWAQQAEKARAQAVRAASESEVAATTHAVTVTVKDVRVTGSRTKVRLLIDNANYNRDATLFSVDCRLLSSEGANLARGTCKSSFKQPKIARNESEYVTIDWDKHPSGAAALEMHLVLTLCKNMFSCDVPELDIGPVLLVPRSGGAGGEPPTSSFLCKLIRKDCPHWTPPSGG